MDCFEKFHVFYIMIAAWKSVDVRYGECYVLMLIDESVFDDMFASMQDGKSTWHLFTADRIEFYRTGQDECTDPDRLIENSNSGQIFNNEDGRPVFTFSMAMTSPDWTMVRRKTNEVLCDSNQAEMFVTVWLGILEISTGRMAAANAGHEYPVICKKDGSFELYKDRHGFVIGGMPGVRYKEYALQMEPGDKIFVYTDGVPEATAGSGEMFGAERMTAALNTCADGRPEVILRRVRSAVDDFVGDAEQFDDLTMMCLEYKGMVI